MIASFVYATSLLAVSYDGILVTNAGDSIQCTILFNYGDKYQYRGEFLATERLNVQVAEENRTYTAQDLQSYSVYLDNKWKTYHSVRYQKKKRQFMKREVHGTMNLYSGIRYSGTRVSYNKKYLLENTATGKLLYIDPETTSTQRKVGEFLAVCPAAAGMLVGNQTSLETTEGWQSLVKGYNENCPTTP